MPESKIDYNPTVAFLFAGGGGDTAGAINAGYDPLWAIEFDKYAAAVYRKRFPNVQVIEKDIKTLSDDFVRSLSKPNLLLGGSPCPDFSTAGLRAGIDGDRGALFFEFVRFLRLLQPEFFIFENVRGLLSSGDGEDFKKVLLAFGEVGYVGTWQLRNGRRWVPQNRERVFVVGHFRERAMSQDRTEQSDVAGMLGN